MVELAGKEDELHVRMIGADAGEVLVYSVPLLVSVGDKVHIYGVVDGRATYATSQGTKETVPKLTAWWIDIAD